MTTEDYVSFETAKLLKEKGFDDVCHAFYDKDGIFINLLQFVGNSNLKGVNEEKIMFAPTLQMAMKWLREVYNIHINLDVHWLYFANQNGWMYVITRMLENGIDYIDSKGDENDKTFYSSYEESCEAAIKYCLENLI